MSSDKVLASRRLLSRCLSSAARSSAELDSFPLHIHSVLKKVRIQESIALAASSSPSITVPPSFLLHYFIILPHPTSQQAQFLPIISIPPFVRSLSSSPHQVSPTVRFYSSSFSSSSSSSSSFSWLSMSFSQISSFFSFVCCRDFWKYFRD